MAEETWSRIEGMVIAASLDPIKVARDVKKDSIVASLAWYDETPGLVGLTLAAQGDKLATLTRRGTIIRPGPTVEEVAEKIAEKFSAEVMLGDVQVDHFVGPEGEEDSEQQEESTDGDDAKPAGLRADRMPIRVAEISATPSSAIPLLAAFEGVDVAELRHDDDRGLLLAQIPGNRSGWHFGDAPLVRLTVQGDEFHAHFVPTDDPEDSITYNWGMNELIVAGAKGWEGPTPDSVQELVGARQDILAIHNAVPGADPERAFAAAQLRGSEAVTEFVRALGLSPQVAEFLLGWLSLEQIPDATLHHARGVSNAIGRSVDILLDERKSESRLWETYQSTVRSKPWLVPAIAAGEVAAATTLFLVGRKQDGSRSLGGKLATIVGAVLLFDALADTTLARLTSRRLIRREEREE